jgi:alpha-N-arabinofuranosidase
VKSASLAQLVNVIAPIMTEPGGAAWRQTTFFPFALTAAHATGYALSVQVTSDSVSTERFGAVAAVEAAASLDPSTGSLSLFLVNRSLEDAASVSIDLEALAGESFALELVSALTLSDDDIQARNTLVDPDRVGPATNETVTLDAHAVSIALPAVSWSVLTLAPRRR